MAYGRSCNVATKFYHKSPILPTTLQKLAYVDIFPEFCRVLRDAAFF